MYSQPSASPLDLTYIGHGTVLIEMDGVRLLTDPLLRDRVGPLRRQGSKTHLDKCRTADAVLISHMHWDHLDPPSLRLLDPATPLIVPQGAERILRRHGFRHVQEIGVGDSTALGAVGLTATWARHPRSRHPLGPSADCLGFVMRGRFEVYFAGDTGLFPGMGSLAERLDVALLPVSGWGPTLTSGHLSPRRAAEALTMLQPRLAIPIHWGTYCPLGMGWLRPQFLSQPPYAFAGHAAQLTPEVEVRILAPGDALHLEGTGFDAGT